ncbi:MAG: sulfonate transport system substrate-binding protein [Bacillota bacterium]|nr:sulfonate transport system substrate-binding protein [Bacillota bacterium]
MARKIIAGLLFVLLTLSLSGCAGGTPQKGALPREINATYVALPLNVPSIVAKDQQLFEKAFQPDGINFRYHNIVAGPAQTEGLAAGSLDFASVLGGTSALLARAQGVDLKVIANYSMSPRGFGIIVPAAAPIKSVADLKGKKVGTAKGTIAHQLLAAALAKAGLSTRDVQFLHMELADAATAVQAGQLDAAVVGEPLLTKAVASGKARLLTDGEGLINAQIVVAVRGEFAKNYPDLVRRYLKVQQQAVDFVRAHRAEALAAAARENNMDLKAVEAIFPKYDFSLALDDKAVQELKHTAGFLKEVELLKPDVDVDKLVGELVDPSFLPQEPAQ